jgi:hypothetical protein
MYRTPKLETTIYGIFSELVKRGGTYKVIETDDFSSYTCAAILAEDLLKAMAYNACGKHEGLAFASAYYEIKTAFKHQLLIVINKAEDVVSFATFTHAPEVIGDFISGCTTELSAIDFRLDNRVQRKSEIFLTMSTKSLETYLKSKAIILEGGRLGMDIPKYLEDAENLVRMANLSELQALRQRCLLSTFKEIDDAKPKLTMTRFNGETGEFQINNFKSINLYKTTSTLIKKSIR